MLGEGKRMVDRDLPRAQVSMWAGNGHGSIMNDGAEKDGVFLGRCQVTHCS